MKYHPLPVIILSSLTPTHSEAALRALDMGAFDVIGKPSAPADIPDVSSQLIRAIRAASMANLSHLPGGANDVRQAPQNVPAVPAVVARRASRGIIALGASTGGPVALEQLLTALPANSPGIVLVQHMPAGFTAAFAHRLNDRCALEVREAIDGDLVQTGVALVAPGGKHLLVLRGDAGLHVAVRDGPQVHYQRPAVDVLFHSVARVAGPTAVGVLLTGMGADGASGMRALRDAGAHTIAQDEATSVVFSMPREAIRFEAACEVLPLPRIAAGVIKAVNKCEPVLPGLRHHAS